ncbi:ASCH domain-containing protein [Lacipirellula parvula]|uniref:ASCH domain-containing protein n=1 Tax=Lacipirellula parvula TaxID=2650471 RepID=UPI001260611E|nr:ASCH domain-containing protein [Lacipirellula parvula]
MLWLSIHPKYVDAILAGEKSIELRRRKPRISEGPALIYATSPRMELVASAWISSVTHTSLDSLWKIAKESAAVSRSDFRDYFDGLSKGTGLHLDRIQPFAKPIGLPRLREIWQGFQPPQGFRYIDGVQVASLSRLTNLSGSSPLAAA